MSKGLNEQLKEVSTNSILQAMCPAMVFCLFDHTYLCFVSKKEAVFEWYIHFFATTVRLSNLFKM